LIRLEIARGVGAGQRRLAEHVEGVQIGALLAGARALQCFADAAAHDELAAHHAHRAAHRHADHRLAAVAEQALPDRAEIAGLIERRAHDAPGQHQAPGRCVDEQRVAGAKVLVPVGFGQLVGDQFLGGLVVRDAQQGLGQTHQQHAFLGRQVVLAHERIERALRFLQLAHLADPAGGLLDDPAVQLRRQFGDRQQPVDQGGFIG
jgi:hypothetical protein